MDHAAFARFVRRAVDEAKQRYGWTVTRLAAETGVGRSTLFRWLSGDGQEFPELAKVRSFCEALHIPVGAAFTALGVGAEATSVIGADVASAVDAATRADIEQILARLGNPRVPATEKKVIRDMLRYLASNDFPHSATAS